MNAITEKFLATLDTKKRLNRVRPDITQSRPRNVALVYEDGSEASFAVDVDHNAFMKDWRDFAAWFERFRQVKIEEVR